MRNFFRSLLLLPFLLVPAKADVLVQQDATMLNAATAVCTFSPSTVAVSQQETVTCTPPGGMFVYITSISFDVCTNGTGSAANQVTWTTTNITGAPVYSFSIAATASICQHWSIPLPVPLKSTAPGTAVTFVSPAGATNNSYHANVVVYYAP